MKRIQGKAVSMGIEIGRAAIFHSRKEVIFREKILPQETEKEIWRLNHAVRKSQAQLRKINVDLQKIMGRDSALIIESQAMLLKDGNLINDIKNQIRRNLFSAERAIKEIEKKYLDIFRSIPDLSFKGKSNDISDILGRMIANLTSSSRREQPVEMKNTILVADDLTPSEAAKLMSQRKMLGLVLNKGGETSHTTILARSLGIPAISDTGNATDLIENDDLLVLDSMAGEVVVNPTSVFLAESEIKKHKYQKYQERMRAVSRLPDLTADGVGFHLLANIELPFESETVNDFGAKGIGLFRTEFLYLDRRSNLSEEEQYLIYKDTAQKVFPHPLVIRTFDLGRDKVDAESQNGKDENPSLGMMAVRIFLKRRDVFKNQIRAILRANASGNLKILFPMITEIEEIHSIRELIAECREELIGEGRYPKSPTPMGIMLEIPASVPLIPHLKSKVDFFSVGTNDLIQYLLAVDRNNPQVSYLFDPFHPAVIRVLNSICKQTTAIGKEVTICGEMAGKPLSALMLLGMGFTRFSMNPVSIPEIKRVFTRIRWKEIRRIVTHLKGFASKSESREYLVEALLRLYPDLFLHHQPL